MALLELAGWIAAVLFSFAIATFLLKKYARAKTSLRLISLIRTKRFNKSADKLSENIWLSRLATFGIIMGFGLLAIDFLYGKKMGWAKRILLWIVSIVLLAVFFVIEPLGSVVLQSPMISKTVQYAIVASFALFGFAGFTISFMAYSAIDIVLKMLSGITPCPGIAPIIPGVQFPNVPKELTPPLHIWLVFFVLLLVHEFSHGIMMRKAKIKIKSFGLILLGFLPFGAFAEPDEKELKKAKPLDALKIYAAGPASNAYSIPIILLIMIVYGLLVFNPFILPFAKQVELQATSGIVVSQVDANYHFCGTNYKNPAFGALEAGMIVKQINSLEIRTPSDLAKAKYNETDTNFLVDKNGTLLERHFGFGDANQLGLKALQFESIKNAGYESPLSYKIVANANNLFDSFLQWLFLLSIAVATANFLPMDPFDGGRMIKILLLPYLKFLEMNKEQTEKLIGRFFLLFVLLLLIVNALPLFLL